MSGDSIDVLPESHNIIRRSDSQGDVSEFSSYSRRSSTVNNSLFGLGFRRNRTGPYLEGNLRLYDTIELPSDVMCCRFNDDGQHLAVGLCDGTIKIFNPVTCQLLYSLHDEDSNKNRLPVTQIRFRPFSPGEKTEYIHIIIATYASGHVKFWHYTSGTCLHSIDEGRQTLSLTINPEGTHFLTAGANPQIYMYDLDTKQRVATMEPSDGYDIMDGHRFRVFAMQYNPNHPHIFISGGWDDTVQYWDDRKVHSVKKFTGPHLCGDALDIDPVHNHILTGSWRKTHVLQIWDFASAVKIKDVPQDTLHHSQLYCAQWLGKDSIICGGTDQNMARTIDRGTLNTTGQLVDLPQGVYCIDNDRLGSFPRVAIGSNRYIYILRAEKKM
ncbi:WD repeat-containing protein 38-like isoform X2 [Physella acuta]|uniref:WD repeat-containing protein 38-like isoform X1 n=1 Tax=Physella acuta TaxID=109671 RepID=UPI0027DDDE35|nr:WD repeat-containing protein 38-like isoform X1 [Physella acuta]XP_059171933.1 WD repeat-containing protein 38-like isoform X2 [Physella acuta]